MKRHIQKSVLVLIMSLLLNTLILFLRLPAPKAALTGDNYITEITGTWSNVRGVDVDSSGNIFLGAGNDILRSTDGGDTWEEKYYVGLKNNEV